MRDAFWQVAWTLEGQHGKHGVWSDAAYLYSAIAATGGVPSPPDEVLAAIDDLYAQYEVASGYYEQLRRGSAARMAEVDALVAHGQAVDAWAASFEVAPHIPNYLTSPGGSQYLGTAAVAIALTTRDIKAHSQALQHAYAVHAANNPHLRQLRLQAEDAHRYLTEQLQPWAEAAKRHEVDLLAALDRFDAANAQWRQAAGRLLAEARATTAPSLEARAVGIADRPRPVGPTLTQSPTP
jgi:hypothetical protein